MQAIAYNTTLTVRKERPVTLLIIMHIIIGLISTVFPIFIVAYVFGFTLYSLFRIVSTANGSNFAAYSAANHTTLEMLFRLNRMIPIWEFGKYSVILILFTALIVEKKKRVLPTLAVVYFILLLPSILVENFSDLDELRKSISFNISGPFSLAISWMYFYNRKFTKKEFSSLLLNIILPIIAILPIIILHIPRNIKSGLIGTSGQSSKAFSGGFGPNEVSLILGFGFFVLAIALLMRVKITVWRPLDFVLAFIFIGFSTLTFSRGGVLTGLFAFFASVIVFIRAGKASKNLSRILIGVIFFGVAMISIWSVLDSLTGNLITDRYVSTVNSKEAIKEGGIDASGRSRLIMDDLEAFSDHPILGMGPGGSIDYREGFAAHTEYSRMLADHGLLGIMALILLYVSFYNEFKKRSADGKIVLIGFALICLLSMLHAAMRLAMVGFSFGLAFIEVDFAEHPLEKAD